MCRPSAMSAIEPNSQPPTISAAIMAAQSQITAQVRRSLFSWPSPRKTWLWNNGWAPAALLPSLTEVLPCFETDLDGDDKLCDREFQPVPDGLGHPTYIIYPTAAGLAFAISTELFPEPGGRWAKSGTTRPGSALADAFLRRLRQSSRILAMEFRRLGSSGFKVPVLSLGTGTFGGKGMLKAWGASDVKEARRLIDICLEAGLNMFDSADVYSSGEAEGVLGGAIKGLSREDLIISTKATFRSGARANDVGSSRYHLTQAVEGSLKRLGTDYIDLFQLHAFDAQTTVEEVLSTLDDFVRAGKIRYIGCSNFSGWHLMKSLAASDRYGWSRYAAHQAYYSLIGRDYEWELMPLALDQGVGAVVWSPLGWGRLTGRIRRGQPLPKVSRLHETAANGPPVDDERLYRVVDALDGVAGG